MTIKTGQMKLILMRRGQNWLSGFVLSCEYAVMTRQFCKMLLPLSIDLHFAIITKSAENYNAILMAILAHLQYLILLQYIELKQC